VDYVIKCSKLNYGMTYKQLRNLACVCGRILQSKFPSSWIDNKIEEIVLFVGFVIRQNYNASPARKYKSVEHHRVQRKNRNIIF